MVKNFTSLVAIKDTSSILPEMSRIQNEWILPFYHFYIILNLV